MAKISETVRTWFFSLFAVSTFWGLALDIMAHHLLPADILFLLGNLILLAKLIGDVPTENRVLIVTSLLLITSAITYGEIQLTASENIEPAKIVSPMSINLIEQSSSSNIPANKPSTPNGTLPPKTAVVAPLAILTPMKPLKPKRNPTELKPPEPLGSSIINPPDPYIGIPNVTVAAWTSQEAESIDASGNKCIRDYVEAIRREDKKIPADPANGVFGPDYGLARFWIDYQSTHQLAIAKIHASLIYRLGPIVTASEENEYRYLEESIERFQTANSQTNVQLIPPICMGAQRYAAKLRQIADALVKQP